MAILVDNPWASFGKGINEGLGAFASVFNDMRQKEQQAKADEAKFQRELQGKLLLEKAKQGNRGVLSSVLENADLSTDQGRQNFTIDWIKGGGKIQDALSYIKSNTPSILDQIFADINQPEMSMTDQNPLSQVGIGMQPGIPQSGNVPMAAPSQVNSGQVKPKPFYEKLSDQQLIQLQASKNPAERDLAKGIVQQRESSRKQFNVDRAYAQQETRDYKKKIDDSRVANSSQRLALNTAEKSIIEGGANLEQFGSDWWAKMLGPWGSQFVTKEGALHESALKEFLVANLAKIKGRPNQWIEQRIASMTSKIGQSKGANLSVLAALKADLDLEQRRIDLFDRIEADGIKTNGYRPPNIAALVDQAMKPYEAAIQDKLAYNLQRIKEQEFVEKYGEKGLEKLAKKMVTRGTPLTIEMKNYLVDHFKGDTKRAQKYAEQMGYRIMSAYDYNRMWE